MRTYLYKAVSMYLDRVSNNPQVIRYNDYIDNRLENIFCLYYLYHNGYE